ncbi:retrotransposon protein [Cucumis melo var. makuwa]|uniref:Retrotransposon protein n=1 Tax=Cucumis melo var. makuwa TaxID=1194695 RepID=A0A5A7UI19_CUCMM|nr:retrotransposon protein [Cucumis melo var. makuwa]
MDRFAETFVNVRLNEPAVYEGYDMPDGNDELPSMYSQGIDIARGDIANDTHVRQRIPRGDIANGSHVRQKFLRLLHEMPDLSNLDRALSQRQLMSRMDDIQGFIEMTDDERKNFCKVLLRDISR